MRKKREQGGNPSTINQPSEWEQILFLESPGLFHKSPDSGNLHKKNEGFGKGGFIPL